MEARRWRVCSHSEPATALHRRQSPYRRAHHELYSGAGWQSALCADRGQRQGLLRSLDALQGDHEDNDYPADETATYEETLCRVPSCAGAREVHPQGALIVVVMTLPQVFAPCGLLIRRHVPLPPGEITTQLLLLSEAPCFFASDLSI